MITLTPARAADTQEIDHLLDAAFGADRHGRTAYRLRLGTAPLYDLSYVARDAAGQLVGSIQLWPIGLKDDMGRTHHLLLLGPVAVSPALQRSGIGKELMAASLAAVDAAGHDATILIGDPEYYGRFGFSADATADWNAPGPVERRRLLARMTPAARRRLPSHGWLGPLPVRLRPAAL